MSVQCTKLYFYVSGWHSTDYFISVIIFVHCLLRLKIVHRLLHRNAPQLYDSVCYIIVYVYTI